jgi:hypothetical protein
MVKSNLKTRRKEILVKLSAGQKLIHYSGWSGRMSERASLEADDGINGSNSYTHIGLVDYKWLVGNGYVKHLKYVYGGKTIYIIVDAGKKALEVM